MLNRKIAPTQIHFIIAFPWKQKNSNETINGLDWVDANCSNDDYSMNGI